MAASSTHPPRGRVRIEYLGFTNVDDGREYRYAVHAPEGACEFRFHIANSAFAGTKVLIQDGPDVCYQQLAKEVLEGEGLRDTSRSILATELQAYRAAHTPVSRTSFVTAGERPAAPPRTGVTS